MASQPDGFYKRLTLIRFFTFVIVFAAALLLLGFNRNWQPMSQVLIETFVVSSMAMILSLPLAWIRTKMVMERKEKQARSARESNAPESSS